MLWQRKLHLIICILLSYSLSTVAQEVKFAQTSFKNIKKASKSLNKPFFVYLYDVDSPDSRLMEATTFKDINVVNTLNAELLPLKIDIATDQGQKLAKRQNIQLMPAILFYDKKGKIMLQQESAIESSDFLKILDLLYGINLVEEQSTIEETKLIAAKIVETTEAEIKSVDKTTIDRTKVETTPEIEIPRKTKKVKAEEVPILNQEILNSVKKNRLKSPDQLFSEREKAPKETIIVKNIHNSFKELESKSLLSLPKIEMSTQVATPIAGLTSVKDAEKIYTVVNAKSSFPKSAKELLLSVNEIHRSQTHELIILEKNEIETVTLKSRYRKATSRKVSYPAPTLVNNVVTKTIIHEKEKAIPSTTSTSKKNKILQLGAFYKYGDVLRNMYRIHKKTDTKVTIIEEPTNGRLMYKLISVDLMSTSEAKKLAASLQQKQIDCFVRSMK